MPDISGAQSLGVARGTIEIDTASLRNVGAAVRGVADQTTSSLGKIDAATKRTESNFTRIGRGLGSIRGELSGIALGAGLLNGLGLGVAANFQEADIKLSGMTGGLANAQKLTADLRKQAFAAGLPFQDMLNMATRLLPTLGGNTKELQKWYDIVKRTAVLNAQEGITGAAFSINEGLSSGGTDLVSLVERFNISRVKMREALAANNGDFRLALDQVLTSMGITTEVADRMGQSFNASFRVAKDAALQFLAEGFAPMLAMYTPLLQQGAAWLAQMRETNPAVAQLGAGLATAAAVGAPALLLLNQLIEAGQKLKALGVLGTLGRGGVLVGAAVGGGMAGLELTRTVGRATGDEGMMNASWGTIGKSVEQLAFIVTKFAVDFTAALKYAGATVEKAMLNLAAAILNATAAFMRRMAEMLPVGGATLNKTANGLDVMAGAARQLGQMRVDSVNRQVETGRQNLLAWAQRIQGAGSAGTGSADNGQAQALAANTAERDKAIREWAKAAADIEREAGQARVDATRQYEQQRSQTIADYERGIARDAADFARQRARQAAQLEREIAAIRADAVSRETKWAEELAEATGAIRTEGNDRLIKLERDYNRDREQAARDHRDRLMSAAARLDAVAVYEERKRYATQSADAEIAYKERTQAERDNLAERIAEENKAHIERLQTARAADAQRIVKMRQSAAEAQALEDEDRALRLQRQAEDHQRQLEKMATAQADRLAQIDTQAARERQALNESFTEKLNDLGTYQQAWRDMQAEQQQQSLDQFGKFWEAFQKQFPDPVQGPRTRSEAGSAWPESFADGGWVRRSGRAQVHAGEYVLTQAQAQAMASGRAAAGGSSVNFEAINVYAAPGQSTEAIGREVTRQIVAMLETVG